MSKIYTYTKFINFCSKVFGGCHTTNGGENINVVCPFCKKIKGSSYNKRKLAIHSSEHVLHCWVCDYKSKNLLHILKAFYPHQIDTYIENFLQGSNISVDKTKKKEKIILPDGFQLVALMDPEDEIRIAVENYLKSRGLEGKKFLWRWRIGVTKKSTNYSGRIIIPSFDSYGFLNYFIARKFINDPKMKRYENPNVVREDIVFNDLNINWKKELTIVEGVFDAFKCDDNVTALLGSSLDANYKLFEKIVINKTPILLALDNDETGQRKTMFLAKKFKSYGIDVKLFPQNYSEEDIGAMTNKRFIELKQYAKIFSEEHCLLEKIHNLV